MSNRFTTNKNPFPALTLDEEGLLITNGFTPQSIMLTIDSCIVSGFTTQPIMVTVDKSLINPELGSVQTNGTYSDNTDYSFMGGMRATDSLITINFAGIIREPDSTVEVCVSKDNKVTRSKYRYDNFSKHKYMTASEFMYNAIRHHLVKHFLKEDLLKLNPDNKEFLSKFLFTDEKGKYVSSCTNNTGADSELWVNFDKGLCTRIDFAFGEELAKNIPADLFNKENKLYVDLS